MVLDSGEFSAKVNHIGIPHGRMREDGGILTENEQPASMSEL